MPKIEAIPTGSARLGRRRARTVRVSSSLGEINVVPLIDVMLVLLVIFMVAAPMMQEGFPIRLPEARRARAVSAPVTITIPASFAQDGRLQIDGTWVPFSVLAERVRQVVAGKEQKNVVLAADGALPHRDVIRVMSELQAAGVQNVGMQTQPPTGGSR